MEIKNIKDAIMDFIRKFSSYLFFTMFMFFYSCKSDKKSVVTSTTGDTKMMKDTNTSMSIIDTSYKKAVKGVKPPGDANQDAINYLYPKNIKEMIWLRAAVNRGVNKDMRAQAVIMLSDQRKLGNQLSEVIEDKKYYLPSIDTANEVNINDKIGPDWDKAWNGKMVADHMEMVTLLSKAQKDVTDPKLKSIILKLIPLEQAHLSVAERLSKKLK